MKNFNVLYGLGCLILFLAISACGQQSDDGLCPIDCSAAIIGSSSASTISTLDSNGDTFFCNAQTNTAVSFSRPTVRRFHITNDSGVGLPRISFNPKVEGPVDGCRTNDENSGKSDPVNGVCTLTEPEYAGIVTPRSEWCSDSCGVATLTFWPVCLGGQASEINASISSGALFGEVHTVTIDGTNDDE